MYFLVSKSSTHTGLVCVKNSATNISSLGPFKIQGLVMLLTKTAPGQPPSVFVTLGH
jgi:hypothetical protein